MGHARVMQADVIRADPQLWTEERCRFLSSRQCFSFSAVGPDVQV